MFFTENPYLEFVQYHHQKIYDKNKDFIDEETYGIDVPMPTDPKIIEYNNSPKDLQFLQYNDLKENVGYRVQIQYHTIGTNHEKRRALIINSNIYEFEFIHRVIVFLFDIVWD